MLVGMIVAKLRLFTEKEEENGKTIRAARKSLSRTDDFPCGADYARVRSYLFTMLVTSEAMDTRMLTELTQ